MQGPNLKRLIAHKMATDAIPAGGGLADGIKFLTTPGRIVDGARQATEWVNAAILAVRSASEPNPWKTADDETIAGEILRQIEQRKKKPLG